MQTNKQRMKIKLSTRLLSAWLSLTLSLFSNETLICALQQKTQKRQESCECYMYDTLFAVFRNALVQHVAQI